MNKSIQILLIALSVTIVLAGSVFGYSYYQNEKSKNQAKVDNVKKAVSTKDAESKELDSIQVDINGASDLDLTEMDSTSKELDQINLEGIQ